MEKIINKILNIVIVILVIFNLVTYQFLAAIPLSRADETVPAVIQEELPAEEPVIIPDEPKETIKPAETTEIQQTSDPENCLDCKDADSVSVNTASETENSAVAEANTGENSISGSASGIETLADETGQDPEAQGAEEDAGTAETLPEENTLGVEETESNPEEILPDAVINTGDASAQVSAVNEINTNVYTENGQKEIINLTGESSGDVNLLETFETLLENGENSSNSENDGQEEKEKEKVVNSNTAQDVENSALASANTGANSIENADGPAVIETGNANAVAGVINLINTNIVGDNWLLAIINILGNWTGDLIVPGEGLLFTSNSGMQFGQVMNVNEAVNVENNVSAEAGTGNNSISGADSASISTGEASAKASAFNLVNTNIVNNNWFFLIINNSGNWVGRVMNWGADGDQENIFEYSFGSLAGAAGPVFDVYNYNSAANVKNTVQTAANTGNNDIKNSGAASISTGNANAWASAFNFVNTNIVGNNWLFGVVNNAGTWNGNVVFAYPDLAVSLSADKGRAGPGETISYTVSYKNVGKAKCGNTELMLSFPQYLLYQSGGGSLSGSGGNDYHWSAEGLKPGEEKSFTVIASVAENVPAGTGSLETVAGVRTDTKEVELSNNYSSEDITVYFSPVVIKDESALSKKESGLEIDREDDAPAYVNALTSHYIKVKNSGKHTLYDIVITEKIKNLAGETVAEYAWPIEKLKKGQTAYIQYQIILDNSAILGTYAHSAAALGYDEYGNEIKSGKAKAEIELLAGASGEISGSSTCGEIIPAAQAAQMPGEVAGTQIKKSIPGLPLWIFLAALVAYYLAINWAMVRKKHSGNSSHSGDNS